MIERIIHKDEVVSFLDSWKSGVVSIGQTYTENNDFLSVAKDFISKHITLLRVKFYLNRHSQKR